MFEVLTPRSVPWNKGETTPSELRVIPSDELPVP
jgi:hypothetical protein